MALRISSAVIPHRVVCHPGLSWSFDEGGDVSDRLQPTRAKAKTKVVINADFCIQSQLLAKPRRLPAKQSRRDLNLVSFIAWLGHFGNISVVELRKYAEGRPQLFRYSLQFLIGELPVRTFVDESVALAVDVEEKLEVVSVVKLSLLAKFCQRVAPFLAGQSGKELLALLAGVPIIQPKPIAQSFL
jgi:hypothetical protein